MIYRSAIPTLDIPPVSLTEFVLTGARGREDKPAFIEAASGRTILFGELESRIRRFAGGLAAHGFGRGDVMALYSYNTPEFMIAFHGAAWLGGTVTTINPAYTAEEIAKQLHDSRASILVCPADLVDRAREAANGTHIQQVLAFEDVEGDEVDTVGVEPHDVVALPYSSGTTGMPKGVMLTHSNLIANLLQFESSGMATSEDVLLGVLPMFHIYGLVAIVNTGVYRGCTVVTMPRFDLEQYLSHVEKYRVTVAHIVPPIVLALAKHPVVDRYDTSALHTIFSGAAPLGRELCQAVAERLGVRVKQGYGMTETSPATHISPVDDESDKHGSVGHLVAGTECRLVNTETGLDAEPGRDGEIWIRGPQVMRGYLNNPEATTATLDADGWLHTGDVAFRDEDGHFFIVDRVKELIKYKGFQVPPAELEALLLTHPAVADAAVVGIPDDEAGELPKAFVVLRGEASADELKAHVAAHVAHYKQLHDVVFIDAIPKSPSGKILRRMLKGI